MVIFIQKYSMPESDLMVLQKEFLMDPNEDLILAVQAQVQKLGELSQGEESFHRQKSRIKWLQEGDQNTSFFQKVVKSRQISSKITSLSCDNGRTFTNQEKVSTEVIRFYYALLGSASENVTSGVVDFLS